MRPLRYTLLLLALCSFLLNGCVSSMMNKLPGKNVSEQLYIDARLHFTIKHPLDWKRLQTPVSSPEYRADTIRWRSKEDKNIRAEMLIRSLPTNKDRGLSDLLSSYLSAEPELLTNEETPVELDTGKALKLQGHDAKQGRLIQVIKGTNRDFIISLFAPNDNFQELLPVFQDVLDSFVEVIKPETE